jgi:hypothetical protein
MSVAAAAADSVTTAVRVAAAAVNIGAAAVNDVSTVAFERSKRSRLTETDDL